MPGTSPDLHQPENSNSIVEDQKNQPKLCKLIREFFGLCRSHHCKSDENENIAKQLRLLREEMMDLVMVLRFIQSGRLKRSEVHESFQQTYKDIEDIIVALDPAHKNIESDSIRRIRDIWELMKTNPLFKQTTNQDNNDQEGEDNNEVFLLRHISVLEELAGKMALEVGYRTIPERVNAWLKLERPGYVLPFHLVFEDELLSETDRKKVLQFLSWKPTEIKYGLIDVASGLIYRYPEKRYNRWLRIMFIMLVFILFSTLFVCWGGVVNSLGLDSIITVDFSDIPAWMLWGAILFGISVHKLIGNVKDNQGVLTSPFRPIGEWSLYLSARTSQILFSILVAVISTISLFFLAGEVPSIEYGFLVGYSIDSFVGLFASGLERASKAQMQKIGQMLEPDKSQ